MDTLESKNVSPYLSNSFTSFSNNGPCQLQLNKHIYINREFSLWFNYVQWALKVSSNWFSSYRKKKLTNYLSKGNQSYTSWNSGFPYNVQVAPVTTQSLLSSFSLFLFWVVFCLFQLIYFMLFYLLFNFGKIKWLLLLLNPAMSNDITYIFGDGNLSWSLFSSWCYPRSPLIPLTYSQT